MEDEANQDPKALVSHGAEGQLQLEDGCDDPGQKQNQHQIEHDSQSQQFERQKADS
jgi:hypothetical protein